MSQKIICPHCKKEFPMEEGLTSHFKTLQDNHLKKIETRLERALTEKTTIENKLANSAIYESKNKAQLLETLNRQTELANEEKVLTEEWNKFSSEIDAYEDSGAPKN